MLMLQDLAPLGTFQVLYTIASNAKILTATPALKTTSCKINNASIAMIRDASDVPTPRLVLSAFQDFKLAMMANVSIQVVPINV